MTIETIERDQRKTDRHGNPIACVSLRVPMQEYRTWNKGASDQGVTLTWFIRMAVASYLKQISMTEAERRAIE